MMRSQTEHRKNIQNELNGGKTVYEFGHLNLISGQKTNGRQQQSKQFKIIFGNQFS